MLRRPTALPSPSQARYRPSLFRTCEARSILVEACLLELLEAVDVLQADAERTGLIDDIGPDAVQRVMAEAFSVVPRPPKPSPIVGPGFPLTLHQHLEPVVCHFAARKPVGQH